MIRRFTKIEHYRLLLRSFAERIFSDSVVLVQESVLLLDRYDMNGTPRALLVYFFGSEEEKGTFQSISKDEASESLSWTIDPINGYYFTTADLDEEDPGFPHRGLYLSENAKPAALRQRGPK